MCSRPTRLLVSIFPFHPTTIVGNCGAHLSWISCLLCSLLTSPPFHSALSCAHFRNWYSCTCISTHTYSICFPPSDIHAHLFKTFLKKLVLSPLSLPSSLSLVSSWLTLHTQITSKDGFHLIYLWWAFWFSSRLLTSISEQCISICTLPTTVYIVRTS